MEIDDSLTFAAGTWRGKPLPYADNLLGTVGLQYRAAFDGMFPGHGADRHLAFEYFVGLVFNGDYGDLESFVTFVSRWLALPEKVWPLDLAGKVQLVPGKEWIDVTGRYNMIMYPWPSPEGEPVLTAWEGLPGTLRITFGAYDIWGWVLWGPRATFHSPGYPDMWRRNPEGLYQGTGDRWSLIAELHTAVEPPGDAGAIGFRRGVLTAVRGYVASEKAQGRDFPDPEATARADNGYIFANWAAEKYGSPAAL